MNAIRIMRKAFTKIESASTVAPRTGFIDSAGGESGDEILLAFDGGHTFNSQPVSIGQSTEAVDNSVDNPPLTRANVDRMGLALKLTIFSPVKKNDVFH
ncbi:hypothetical protein N015_19375 [Pseudomonas asturiensis]|uniref:Uncharacterized protein n=1 Tax=Pseudomonas asturiensis TaxID=1190415 RepID=A0ABX6HFR2_9PSED|nr:hypothetical protein [Pseudomonas asturiensis]QHF04448.1 hypothetical protein N015_19375 [Pseudomonas asturiensis]